MDIVRFSPMNGPTAGQSRRRKEGEKEEKKMKKKLCKNWRKMPRACGKIPAFPATETWSERVGR
jgi:hypothetical protein